MHQDVQDIQDKKSLILDILNILVDKFFGYGLEPRCGVFDV
jgi:hypothetical protein